MRKPFQGVTNIIRFNWHFFAVALAFIFLLVLMASLLGATLQLFAYAVCTLVLISIVTSLLVSWYVYDLSGIYNLTWIDQPDTDGLILNINAGFDETSALLKKRFTNAAFIAMDFYDRTKHTEVSIKRARSIYPPFPGTKQIESSDLQLPDHTADRIFVIFSAHEIRHETERITFFKELNRVLKPNGQIYITEHLRDVPNFLAYNIGYLHFYSKSSWFKIFKKADLQIHKEIKLTPFVSAFILNKNGNTP